MSVYFWHGDGTTKEAGAAGRVVDAAPRRPCRSFISHDFGCADFHAPPVCVKDDASELRCLDGLSRKGDGNQEPGVVPKRVANEFSAEEQ